MAARENARPLWPFFAVMPAAQLLWFTRATTPMWHGFAQCFRAPPLT